MTYHHNNILLPLNFEIIEKPMSYCDLKTRQIKRESLITKNEMLHQMFLQMLANSVKFKYILFDSWFSSKETFELIRKKKDHFIDALKNNRLVALSAKDRRDGHFHKVRDIALKDGEFVRGRLKRYSYEFLFCRQVFTNKDGSRSSLDLVCIAKSPTKMVRTQSNHLFLSICSTLKLEQLKFNNQMNHFVLKAKLYLKSLKAAYSKISI
ncbi:hypothetical protein RFI36_04450 [Acinetobacter gerneri]|uniref:Transposase n=1 Tax=Acinetobacter gerneri TaxID=202952 RepID=A0AAW8JFG2_9GAMM|nr:hypothetical protein [Acinetobacter gerneri]MDQ9009078.1 hypothetical protein [Acinetobacter gerneri]MDQ9013182.1 hypothetical protein [Acinetobacter gerneri]MDQ9024619.1 hypothetical protein [Acinetobacter gerneri]MDQ9051854.1 hypothetical protein [Acinetobacter gerneri]MDQ9059165.1 hypothetical protein [Acinetobacter gerneri]